MEKQQKQKGRRLVFILCMCVTLLTCHLLLGHRLICYFSVLTCLLFFPSSKVTKELNIDLLKILGKEAVLALDTIVLLILIALPLALNIIYFI